MACTESHYQRSWAPSMSCAAGGVLSPLHHAPCPGRGPTLSSETPTRHMQGVLRISYKYSSRCGLQDDIATRLLPLLFAGIESTALSWASMFRSYSLSSMFLPCVYVRLTLKKRCSESVVGRRYKQPVGASVRGHGVSSRPSILFSTGILSTP